MRTAALLFALGLLFPALARGEEAGPSRPHELRQAVDVTVVALVSSEALKRAIEDPRPLRADGTRKRGYGFPSGHTTVAFGLARVASEYRPKQRTLWYALAAGVAWSRVERRAHDWDDVIGGALLGSGIGDLAVSGGGIVLKRWEW